MANEEQLSILRQGVDVWNKWVIDRLKQPTFSTAIDLAQAELSGANLDRAKLAYADFRNADLSHANIRQAYIIDGDFREANLSHANLSNTDLSQADLRGANLTKAKLFRTSLTGARLNGVNLVSAYLQAVDLTEADLSEANLTKADLLEANLTKANLSGANLNGATLVLAHLNGANLGGASLEGVNLSSADLDHANLTEADLSGANLSGAHLNNVILTKANLSNANLSGIDLDGVNLVGAILSGADLSNANLSNANLSNADLRNAKLINSSLVRSTISNANISKSKIYGVNVWDLVGEFKEQMDLIITPPEESIITVDNIKVAQFIYLLLNNKEIRDVINTLTSKTVLILGRFSIPERKRVLDALRNKLREYDLLPIVFDFDRPADKDFTETIKTLAGISYFVIADVTNPKSSPLELQATVPDYQIPFVPIIQEGENPFAMMANLQTKYNWVLDTISYDSLDTLIEILKPHIIDPAIKKHDELRMIKAKVPTVISGRELKEKKG